MPCHRTKQPSSHVSHQAASGGAKTTSLRNTYFTPCSTTFASCSRHLSSPCRCSSARPTAGITLTTTRPRGPAAAGHTQKATRLSWTGVQWQNCEVQTTADHDRLARCWQMTNRRKPFRRRPGVATRWCLSAPAAGLQEQPHCPAFAAWLCCRPAGCCCCCLRSPWAPSHRQGLAVVGLHTHTHTHGSNKQRPSATQIDCALATGT